MRLPRTGLLIPILLLFILTVVFLYESYGSFCASGPLESATTIIVNRGADLDDIARLLETENVIRSAGVFRLGVRMYGMSRKLKAGEFFIPRQSSAKDIMEILVSGKTVIRSLTIPEGLPSITVVDLINNAAGLSGDLIEEIPENGALMPETYHYQYGMKRRDLFNRMQDSMARFVAEIWDKRAVGLPFKTQNEAMTLASIVERETAKSSEYKTVASVYINRLKKDMKLQADPTVIFALTDGKMNLKRSPTYDELKMVHPYNTYTNKGLPPMPICNPSKKAIEAVLNPESTTYVFFVADGTGGHIFTSNFKEHWVQAEKWRKINRQNTLRNKKLKEALEKEALSKTASKPATSNAVSDTVKEDKSTPTAPVSKTVSKEAKASKEPVSKATTSKKDNSTKDKQDTKSNNPVKKDITKAKPATIKPTIIKEVKK